MLGRDVPDHLVQIEFAPFGKPHLADTDTTENDEFEPERDVRASGLARAAIFITTDGVQESADFRVMQRCAVFDFVDAVRKQVLEIIGPGCRISCEAALDLRH